MLKYKIHKLIKLKKYIQELNNYQVYNKKIAKN